MGKIKIIKGDITKLTKGYNLPSRFVIHTVRPIYFENTPSEAEALLTSCYENSLNLAKEKGLKTIAVPLISAGVYGYPQREVIKVAIETMKLHQDDFDEITLVLFGEREDLDILHTALHYYIQR